MQNHRGETRRSSEGRGVIARINASIDALVQRALGLVAHRLNQVVAAVDRADGGTGRGIAIATAMAQVTGFEVREQQLILTSDVLVPAVNSRLPAPELMPAGRLGFSTRRETSRLHRISRRTHALN